MPVANSVAVLSGQTSVSGYQTTFIGTTGDLFILNGAAVPIASVAGSASLTLQYGWPGSSLSDQTHWSIVKTADYWNDNVGTLSLVNDVLNSIRLGLPLKIDKAGSFADRAQYDNALSPFMYLATTPSPPRLYVKNGPTGADWSIGIALGSDTTQAAIDAAAAAESSKAAAASSATAAATSATNSATYASNSATSATQAESNASVAAATNRLYTTTAAGIAGSTNGQYFYVLLPSPNEKFADLYRNDSGAATYINTLPSKLAIDAVANVFLPLSPGGLVLAYVDEYGQAALGLLDDGTLRSIRADIDVLVGGRVGSRSGQFQDVSIAGLPFAFIDDDGLCPGGIKSSGQLRWRDVEFDTINSVPIQTVLSGGSGSATKSKPRFQADVTSLHSYGQSLAVGQSATPPITTTQRFNNIKFAGGVRTQDTGSPYTSFVALTETTSSDGTLGETPISGAAECIVERVNVENGLAFSDYQAQFIGTAPGVGGTGIVPLADTSGGAYQRLVADMTNAKTLANAGGKTFRSGAVFWTQGSTDYANALAKATYKSTLAGLVGNISSAATSLTGQPYPVPMLCMQSPDHYIYGNSNNPYIALAQLESSKEIADFYIACAGYLFPTVDGTHLTPSASKWLGAYYGLAYKRVVIDGEGWSPLDCIDAWAQGSTIFLRFNVPSGKLVWDITQRPSQTASGFGVVASDGAAYTLAENPVITGPDTVRIRTTINITSGSAVRYGFGNGGGNLRDQQGDSIVFDPTGLNKRLDNWCVIFERIL